MDRETKNPLIARVYSAYYTFEGITIVNTTRYNVFIKYFRGEF